MAKVADPFLLCEPWRIIERGWDKERNTVGEAIFSLSNEYMGVRGYAEEGAAAESLLGSYFGGVYEWGEESQGGYKGIVRRTHYMVCAADFLAVRLRQGDAAICLDDTAANYERTLDLRTGLLSRQYTTVLPDGARITLCFRRLVGMDNVRAAVQDITLTADRDTSLSLELWVNGSVCHQSTGRCQWTQTAAQHEGSRAGLRLQTASTKQTVEYLFAVDAPVSMQPLSDDRALGFRLEANLQAHTPFRVTRRILNTVNPTGDMSLASLDAVPDFNALLAANTAHYAHFWRVTDVEIGGDGENQQGIRFCLFQLHQTYRGLDGQHNIGAKGLTGEAYNGHAFWDSETYCLPYYLLSDPAAAKSLLMFRYNTLPQAKERARQLDCEGACYPIATLNGHEACTLWQHASLQMQPSTAVAYAVMRYVQATGDTDFLYHEGIAMLAEISRYVVSRGGWNSDHTGFGFWGVMGPDEFHMMVNNNFYTNYMGKKTLDDTLRVLDSMPNADDYATPEERTRWKEIASHMLITQRPDGVIEQHDGYFTLPHIDIHTIPVSDFPLYDHWSYDRIFRTDMLKQPDVLMAMFIHPEDFSERVLRANYNYYEPRCIHESSLSPAIHAILAQSLGLDDAAFNFFGFTTRMDLDNYNRNAGEGLHLANIAAAWMTIVHGFGGLRMENGHISLTPRVPEKWDSLSFRFRVKDSVVCARVTRSSCKLFLVEGAPVRVTLNGKAEEVSAPCAD